MLLAGFVVLMMLMVTVIYNDLTRISWIERLMPWRVATVTKARSDLMRLARHVLLACARDRWRLLWRCSAPCGARSAPVTAPTSSGCRTTSSTRRATSAAPRARRARSRRSLQARARRCARRSDLPEGQAAQERADRAPANTSSCATGSTSIRAARARRRQPSPSAASRAAAGRGRRRHAARLRRTTCRSAPSSTCACRPSLSSASRAGRGSLRGDHDASTCGTSATACSCPPAR